MQPQVVNAGNGATTPIALPDGAKSVRFFTNTDAVLRVDTRDKAAGTKTVSPTYDSASSVDVPDGIHGFVVHRDAGDKGNDVSYVVNF